MTNDRGASPRALFKVGGIVAIVALFAAVSWLQWFGGEAGAATATGDSQETVESVEQAGVAAPAAPAVTTTEDETTRNRVEVAAPAPAPVPEPAADGLVRGRVIVVDVAGNEHPETNGELELALWDDRVGHHAKVAVENGRFVVEPRADTTAITVNTAVLEGKTAYVKGERLPIAAEIEIHAKWLPPTILRVVDAEYGLDLTDITIVGSSDWRTDDNPHPGAYDSKNVRVEGGRSPLELMADTSRGRVRWQEPVWVHSPGYAWGRINVDFATATERRVELQRGGRLEVFIEGRLPTPAAGGRRRSAEFVPSVRLRHVPEPPDIDKLVEEALAQLKDTPDSEIGGKRPTEAELRKSIAEMHTKPRLFKPVAEAPARLATATVFDGLPPGSYHVGVELGNWWDSPLAFGAATATVTAGATQSITVRVEPPPERTRVPLAGTFFLPPAWEMSRLSLRFEPLGVEGKTPDMERQIGLQSMKPDPGTAGLFHWDAGLVVASRYEVTCYTLDMQWVVDTGPNGNRTAQIVVGEPVDVRVQVFDETTGSWLSDVRVLWNGKRPKGVMGGSLGNATWNAETERHEFRAAAGPVEIAVHSRDYLAVGEREFAIGTGSRDVTLRVQRTCGVILRLQHGDEIVPWDDATMYDTKLRAVDGEGRASGFGGTDDHGLYMRVMQPGTYRVEIPDQPGFETVAPFDVQIEAGKFTTRDVQLVPKR